MPKAFPAEFRRNVIDVAKTTSDPLAKVARDFGVGESTIHKWIMCDNESMDPELVAKKLETAELRELKRRNVVLEQENEILRRAAAFFAREISPK
jgi:transposase